VSVFVARCTTTHDPASTEVEATTAVQSMAIIPNHQIMDTPMVCVDESWLRGMLKEFLEEYSPFGDGPTNDAARMCADKE
jgi:hypothetical protein